MNENGGGKDGFPNKTAMESGGGATGLVGAEFAGHGDWAENHGLGEVDRENRVLRSICFVGKPSVKIVFHIFKCLVA